MLMTQIIKLFCLVLFIVISIIPHDALAKPNQPAEQQEAKPEEQPKEQQQEAKSEEQPKEKQEAKPEEQPKEQKPKDDAKNEENNGQKEGDNKENKQPEKKGSGKLEVITEITKPELDPKQYRGLVLPNEMKVLLVSDSEADFSIGSVAVEVGYIETPKDVLGLPHLTEHAVFLGSKNFPDKAYDHFLNKNGGYSNAQTDSWYTCYYFGINSNSFKTACEGMADMLISPTLDNKAIEAEMEVVNEEFTMHAESDFMRTLVVKQETCSPDHNYHLFAAGNEETLMNIPKKKKLDLSKELRKFFDAYYSANCMAAVLYSKENLDQLQAIAVDNMGKIPNKNVECPLYKDPPYTKKELEKVIYITPLEDIYQLQLTFNIPDPRPDYAAQPMTYINYFISNRGENSVYAFLKQQGWVENIVDTNTQIARHIAVYEITVYLTPSGVENVDPVVGHIFEYINLLRTDGVQESYYEEIGAVCKTNFQWSFKDDPSDSFSNLSVNLLNYDMKDILIAGNVPLKWEPDVIHKYLECLNPENMRLVIVSKTVEKSCDKTEQWMGVKYGITDMKSDMIETCKAPKKNDKLKLPDPNKFVPEKLELLPAGDKGSKLPVIIKDTEMCRAFFKQDDMFLLPLTNLNVIIMSPIVSATSKDYVLEQLFTQLIYESLEEVTYPAMYAGYRWGTAAMAEGVQISFAGYSDKLPLLAETVFSNIHKFTYSDLLFNNVKDRVTRGISSSEIGGDVGSFVFWTLMTEKSYFVGDQVTAIKDVTVKDMDDFRARLLESVYIQISIYGNTDKEGALKLVEIVESKFKESKPIPAKEIKPTLYVYFEEGKSYLYRWETDKTKNSDVQIYYQCGEETIYNIAVLEVFAAIISPGIFEQLRTEEKLGYLAKGRSIRCLGVQGMFVEVMSSEYSPEHLDSRIEAYLSSVEKTLETMKAEDFETFRTSVENDYLQKPSDMAEQNGRYYVQMARMTYDFGSNEKIAAEVKKITKEQIIEFYNTYIKAEAKSRTKFAVYVIPKGAKLQNPSKYEPGKEVIVIEDVAEFKKTVKYAAVPLPPDDIPPLVKNQGEGKNDEKKSDDATVKKEEKPKPEDKANTEEKQKDGKQDKQEKPEEQKDDKQQKPEEQKDDKQEKPEEQKDDKQQKPEEQQDKQQKPEQQ